MLISIDNKIPNCIVWHKLKESGLPVNNQMSLQDQTVSQRASSVHTNTI